MTSKILLKTLLRFLYTYATACIFCTFFLQSGHGAVLSYDDWEALACSHGEARLREVLAKDIDINQPIPDNVQSLTPLMACLEKGQEDLALLLLNKGASAAPKSADGWTALDIAAGYVRYDVMAKLILADGNVDGSGDYAPLFMAAQHNQDVQVTRLLVQSGANVQRADKNKETVIMRAALNPNSEVFLFLLRSGANWRAVTEDKRTAVFFAAQNHVTTALEQILSLGLSANDISAWGETPLFNAVVAGNQRGAEILLAKGAKADVVNKNGQSVLHSFFPYADPDQERFLQLLLNAGADPNKVDNSGLTPLLYAAESVKNEKMVALLLEKGADIQAVDNRGITPLLMACLNENPSVVSYLLAQGADPKATDNYGTTSLMYVLMPLSYTADDVSWFAVMQTLLQAGVDINAQNSWGRTALSLAASGNKVQVLQFLLDRKANPSLCDAWDMPPLFWAANSGSIPKVELLLPLSNALAQDKEGQDVFFWAAANPARGKLIAYLLGKGLSPVLSDKHGRTPLMYLAAFGDPTEIPLLIKVGCKVNAVDKEGRTPLMWSVFNQQDMLEALLATGAFVDQKDATGRTALHYYAAGTTTPAAIQLLAQKTKDPDAVDNAGRTPLMYGAAYAPAPVLAALFASGAKTYLTDANGWTALHYLMSGNPTTETMAIFLESRVNGSAKDNKGATALHVSGQYVNIAPPLPCPTFSDPTDNRRPKLQCGVKKGMVSTLVLGAMMQIVHGVDSRDNYGRTAFMLFAQNCAEQKPLQKFVWAGAMINTIDNSGMTPLMYAARYNSSVAVVNYLIEVHANVSSQDLSGKSALMHAVEAGAPIIVIESLVEAGANKVQKDSKGKRAADYLPASRNKYTPEQYGQIAILLTP